METKGHNCLQMQYHPASTGKCTSNRATKSSCGVCMIDAKSFLAGMLLVGFVVLFQQTSLPSLSNNHQLHAISTSNDTLRPISSAKGKAGCYSKDNYHNDQEKGAEFLAKEDNHNINSTHKDDGSRDSNDNTRDELMDNQLIMNDLGDGHDDDEDNTVTKNRSFRAYGHALALFVHMGSYRGGPDSFAVIGLGAKPAHVYGNAGFECEWVPRKDATFNSSSKPISKGVTRKFLPDWNMGRQYTVVVVNCSFEEAVGTGGEGGELVVYALYGEGSGMPNTMPERIVALKEKKGEYDAQKFLPPYPYDYVYCGSPLYGGLNAQRIREWMAYHVKVFGKHTHFFLHDAGGITESVARALQPWQKRGYVTVQDIRDAERYDGYYHNQFLVVNDCLHRTRFLSKWTFFFDVDEYLWLPSNESLGQVMQGFSNYTQVIFRQKPMAPHICQAHLQQHLNISRRKWGFEKLVYRDVKAGMTWDRKYAIQPRNALTTGVHRSDHIVGNDIVRDSLGYFPDSLVPNLWYFHFHNTITHSAELCRIFAPPSSSSTTITPPTFNASSALEPPDFIDTDGTPFRLDTTLQHLARAIKDFELQEIGPQPSILD